MLKKRGLKTTSLISLIAAIGAAPAYSAEDNTQSLEQRVLILERQLEIQKEEAETKAKDATIPSAGEKGFSLKKGDYELKFNLLAQTDARVFLGDSGSQRLQEGFVLRRLRPTFQGSLGKLVGFRLAPEFAGNGSGLGGGSVTVGGSGATPATGTALPTTSAAGANSAASIVDAYFDLKFHPAASLRIGKQKGPVGLERLQSGGAISFIERGYPTELVPNRDIGVALYGEVLSGTLNYTVGLFNGAADGRDIGSVDADNRHEVEGRIFAEPFKNEPGVLRNLGFGIGGSSGSKKSAGLAVNNALPRYRTPGQNVFFSYTGSVAANGTHTRLAPQLYYYYNNLGVLGEYVRSRQAVISGTTQSGFTNTGYEITATYVLTGEHASYKGVVQPRCAYTVNGEGWGAVELAARVGGLTIDDGAFAGNTFANINNSARKATSFGAGINWYLTSNAKLVLDYDQTQFKGGAAGGADRQNEKALFTRLQVTYY